MDDESVRADIDRQRRGLFQQQRTDHESPAPVRAGGVRGRDDIRRYVQPGATFMHKGQKNPQTGLLTVLELQIENRQGGFSHAEGRC